MTITKIITNKELYLSPPEGLEQAVNYNFDNKDLLFEALSHPSLKQHDNLHKNYERLEFLGDAIISFIITEMLFKEFFVHDEGTLAKIRAYLVSKELLCKVADKINLADYIIMTHGEQALGGRKNPNNIENTMEALIAAIYLDSNLTVTQKIIVNLWGEFISVKNLADYDPKSTLQELAQSNSDRLLSKFAHDEHMLGNLGAQNLSALNLRDNSSTKLTKQMSSGVEFGRKSTEKPIYEVISREGPPHASIFTVSVKMLGHEQTGSGHSVKEAEKAAARKLITILKSL
jgi:ribonuclease III